MATDDKCCTIVPYFKIHAGRIPEFKAICEQLVAATKNEPGCLYYGFSFDDDQAHCREGYRDGVATIAHIENVASLLGELLKVGDVVRFELHGPGAELEKLRAPFAKLNPQYFELEYGFRR